VNEDGESQLLARPPVLQARGKSIGRIPRLVLSTVIGILGGAAFYIFMFTFALVLGVGDHLTIIIFLLLTYVGCLIVAVLAGLLTYRALSK